MISFGFFIDWQLGIVLLWLLYRAALVGRIPLVAARAYLLAVVPVAAAVAGFKIETLHAVLAVPTSLVESVGASVAGSEGVAAFDWGVLYYNNRCGGGFGLVGGNNRVDRPLA